MKGVLLKIFAAVLSVIMLCCTAACGNNKGTGQNANNGGGTSSGGSGWADILKNMPEDLRGTSITVYSWNDVTDVTNAQTVIDNFTKDTGIKVNWVKGTYTNYATEIASKVAAKEGPDVVRLMDLNLGLLSVLQPMDDIEGFNIDDSAWDM